MTFNARFHKYGLNTAAEHNAQLASIIDPGVYAGYFMRVNSADATKIDLFNGADAESALVTTLGVKISLTDQFLGAASMLPSGPSDRVDTLILEYPYSGVESYIEPTVRIIRDGATIPPDAITLGYVHVRAFASRLYQTDLWPIARPNKSLACIVDPTGSTGIYVFGGKYRNSTGTGIVDFKGGYYSFVDTVVPGSYAWFLLGLDDSGDLVVLESGATLDALDIGGHTEYAVAAVQVSSTYTVHDIETCVVPSRSSYVKVTADDYKDALGNSVFKYISIDVLDDNTKSRTAPTNGRIKLPVGTTYVLTGDMFDGHTLSQVQHVCLLVDASCPVTYTISRDDNLDGDSDTPYSPNEIVRVTNLHQAFLKIEIDPSYATSDQYIYGYALLYTLDSGTVNRDTLSLSGWSNLNANIGSIAPSLVNFPYSWRQSWGDSPAGTLVSDDSVSFPAGVPANSKIYCKIPAAPYIGKALSFTATHVSGAAFRVSLKNSNSEARTAVVSAGTNNAVSITVNNDADYIEAAIEAISTVSATSPIVFRNPRVCVGVYGTLSEQSLHIQDDLVFEIISVYHTVYGSVGMEIPISVPVRVRGTEAIIIADNSSGFNAVSAAVSDGALLINGTLTTEGLATYHLKVGVRV